ncbi:hypothetical protein GCM10020255_076790 [Rhodococcus baikonurensis]
MTALDVPAGSVDVRQSGALTWVRARAEWAPEFAIYPMDTVDDVIDADPSDYEADHSYLWAWQDKLEAAIRARMFAPVMGIAEDEATGSAALRITDRLRKSLLITQGRGSVLHTTFSPKGGSKSAAASSPSRHEPCEYPAGLRPASRSLALRVTEISSPSATPGARGN